MDPPPCNSNSPVQAEITTSIDEVVNDETPTTDIKEESMNENDEAMDDESNNIASIEQESSSDVSASDSDSEYDFDFVDNLLEEGIDGSSMEPPSKKRKLEEGEEEPRHEERTRMVLISKQLKMCLNCYDNNLLFLERDQDHFEILPEGWVEITHFSGMPVFLVKPSFSLKSHNSKLSLFSTSKVESVHFPNRIYLAKEALE